MRIFFLLAIALACLGLAPPNHGAPVLTLTVDGRTRAFTAAQLSAQADAQALVVPDDVAYGRTMTFRAVPLRAMLAQFGPIAADTIEFRATDGFVAQIPRALIDGGSVPWIAIEDSRRPWPRLPKKAVSAGPFYLVWQNPRLSGVSTEQWPYSIAALTAVASPAQRWPGFAVDASVPAGSDVRRGQALFVANCMSCHRAGGSGEAEVGPDLLQPMPVTAYLTDPGLRALIRNPDAVRTWPGQRMPGFDASVMADKDIDALIAYLHYLAARRAPDRRQ